MDWREAFIKYILIIARAEGIDYLGSEDWTPEEWAEIQKAMDEAESRWKRK